MRGKLKKKLICYLSKTLEGLCDIFYKQDSPFSPGVMSW